MDRESATAECAYFIWLAAGCPEGKALDHWLQAEAELVELSQTTLTVAAAMPEDGEVEVAA